jgi:hypothetical protein
LHTARAATEPLPLNWRTGGRNWRTGGRRRVSRPRVLSACVLALIAGVVLAAVVVTDHPASPSTARRHAPFHDLSTLPLAAQGVISGAVGADSAAYRVRRSGAGFRAQSAGQGLRLRFDGSGVHVSSGTTQLGLSLQAWGYGKSLQTVRPVRPSGSANRVTYNRSGLSEWYRNGPLGLEQGFTVYRAPASPASRPLTLSIPLSGNEHASLAPDRESLSLTRAGQSSLRYAGLVATDARARPLRSWLELHGGRMLVRVDTRGARYPVRIDPFFQQAKLTGGEEINNATLGAKFGLSVALSSDGNTALVGAHEDKGGRGAAWVFTRQGATWSQQGPKLTGKQELTGGRFGGSAALSSDGNTALIGGPGDRSGVGAFWVFARSGSTWTQQGPKLTAQGEVGLAFFGVAGALSGDGNTALVSGTADNGSLGAAWVFTRAGTTWSQQAKLTGNEEIGKGSFGRWGVALSSDGNTALIGGPGDNANVGAAWVFTRAGTTWSPQAKLTGNEEIGAGHFGYGDALSSDGNTALIGGPMDNDHLGAAWVFTRAGATWTQQAKLTGTEEIKFKGVDFGKSLALSSDGDTALVGGSADDQRVGAAWLFGRAGATWSQQAKLTGKEEIGDAQFGRATALSSNGNTVLIGGPHDNGKIGAAWVFVRE